MATKREMAGGMGGAIDLCGGVGSRQCDGEGSQQYDGG